MVADASISVQLVSARMRKTINPGGRIVNQGNPWKLNSSSMIRLSLAVSLCRSRSLPNVSIQGLLSLSRRRRSLSTSASETSARKGIPRSAATVLARRKIASGISNVVFMKSLSHIMGTEAVHRGGLGFTIERRKSMNDQDTKYHEGLWFQSFV